MKLYYYESGYGPTFSVLAETKEDAISYISEHCKKEDAKSTLMNNFNTKYFLCGKDRENCWKEFNVGEVNQSEIC